MNKDRKIYYKVIIEETRKSFITLNTPDIYYKYQYMGVKYPTKEWAKPIIPYSKLFVFDCEHYASLFINAEYYEEDDWTSEEEIYHPKIVPCYIKNPIKIKELMLHFTGDTLNNGPISYWQDFKKNKKNLRRFFEKNRSILRPAPKGTVFCDAVYCLE